MKLRFQVKQLKQVTTTGGNTVSSSEVTEVTDVYNESIEAGMVEILNTSGFELIDGGDLDLEEQSKQ